MLSLCELEKKQIMIQRIRLVAWTHNFLKLLSFILKQATINFGLRFGSGSLVSDVHVLGLASRHYSWEIVAERPLQE
jgi:hypothetical protein